MCSTAVSVPVRRPGLLDVGVTSTPDGGVESGAIPLEQASAHEGAMYACAVTYPLDPKYSVPLSETCPQIPEDLCE